MKNAKLILLALGILAAAMVVWFLVGVVVSIVKILFVVAVIVLGISVIRKLTGKSRPAQLGEPYSDGELKEAMRQLEEIKQRQQLTK